MGQKKGDKTQGKRVKLIETEKRGWWTLTIKGKRLRKGDKERRYQKDRRQCRV
jgi:hypothetical protein